MELAEDDEEALVDGRLNRDSEEVEGVARSLGDLCWETSRCGDRNSFPTGVSRNRMASWVQSALEGLKGDGFCGASLRVNETGSLQILSIRPMKV